MARGEPSEGGGEKREKRTPAHLIVLECFSCD